MTRTSEGWQVIRRSYLREADRAEQAAARYDAMSNHASTREDTLVSDVYAQAGYRALADADFWREHAARAEAYSLDAALPVMLTVVRSDAGCVSAETAVVTAITFGSVLFLTACALIGLG